MLSLMAVALPEGATTIELRFESEPYSAGRGITLLMAGLALLLIPAGVLLDRRRAASAPSDD